jgi:hypothetical protein
MEQSDLQCQSSIEPRYPEPCRFVTKALYSLANIPNAIALQLEKGAKGHCRTEPTMSAEYVLNQPTSLSCPECGGALTKIEADPIT